MEAELVEAVRSLDTERVLSVLVSQGHLLHSHPELLQGLFFVLVEGLSSQPGHVRRGAQMVYLLRNLGSPINPQDEEGNTPLMQYLHRGDIAAAVVEAFLRCNADVYLANKDGEYPLEVVTLWPDIPKAVRDVFMKYVPGIWEAVEGDDAMNVRKLINQWCRGDIEKDGKTLLQAALDVGTESIIRVVAGIKPSMEFAHGVLAGDIKFVKSVLTAKKKININFRNMGDGGATPLWYALQQGNAEMVQLLLDHGARTDIGMKGEGEFDIPIYFAALAANPPLSTELLKLITPSGPLGVDRMVYKGKNVLFHCIENGLPANVVEYILNIGSAALVTQRVENNICARQYASQLDQHHLVDLIDSAVMQWMLKEDGRNRKVLLLHGYEFIPPAIKSLDSEADSCPLDPLYRCLPVYEEQIDRFHRAVEAGDAESVRMLMYFRQLNSCHGNLLEHCLADSRRRGAGQPALHKAVLRGHAAVAVLLAETLVYQQKQRLDSVRDQSYRTALHYAHATENGKDLVDILLDYGASEFTMDKDGRSPLAFKDRRGQKLMNALLEYQLIQDLSEPEPDPWSVPMPIPIIGYLLSCSHGSHLPTSLSQRLAALPCPNAQRRRSLPEARLNKVIAKSPSLASQLAHLPDAVRQRLANRACQRYWGVEGEYLPLPTDEEALDVIEDDDDDDSDHEHAEDKDNLLMRQREMRKASSCVVQ